MIAIVNRRSVTSGARDNLNRLFTWSICWILLPNAAFMWLWIIGAPPRYSEIITGGAIGLIVRNARYPIRLAAFVLLMIYSALSFVAALFNFRVSSLIESLSFLIEMRPESSIEYYWGAVALIVTLLAGARLLRMRTDFRGNWAIIAAIAITACLAGLDALLSLSTSGAYQRATADGAPFDSGVRRSGFASQPDGRRDLILVIVESLGQPHDPATAARLIERWKRADIAARYDFTQGTAPYFGSTTSAEMRALCGRWGNYAEVMEKRDKGCLPARLRKAGYATLALHSFDGAFFDRARWYPNMGFERRLFRDDLIRRGAASCPGVFPGACDRDVPGIIYRELKADPRPQFIYWLTVNSHLPVPISEALNTGTCRADLPDEVRRFPMLCRQFALWLEIEERLAEQMTKPDFPDADILLVGDHMPPYFDGAQRSQFDPENVPWMLLRRKTAPGRGLQHRQYFATANDPPRTGHAAPLSPARIAKPVAQRFP
ncbi:sulfatase-like hydrolase/transferase [uncultured Sphingomonas sp.]|uniref:sulfatase-like hydrolase/transferase n=1 Tax=uncultured Sphingomonas sp. TaxID=158754 RepID=UPI002611A5CF|nr:sulfatase-like hydrolase/transferase [uncultured Sphingomonas sp.]